MSISKLIPLIADNLNKAHDAYYDHTYGWVNGFSHATCRSFANEFLDYAPHKLAAEKQLNLSLFGKLSVLDESSPDTEKGIHISFRPAPKLIRLIEQTQNAKTSSLKKVVAEKIGVTLESAAEIIDVVQQEICATLVKNGKITIQQLGTFLVTNDEAPETKMISTVRFRSKPYLKDLLSTLTDKQVNKMITAREKKRASRKKPAVSSGSLDRKRLARVRKLLHSRDPDNVAMAILVLEQVALPEDYVAVFETSGLIERLLRSDSAAVADAAAKIAVAAKNDSVFDRFCEMIGLKSTVAEPKNVNKRLLAYTTAKCPECGSRLATNLAKKCLNCGANWDWRPASQNSQSASTYLDIRDTFGSWGSAFSKIKPEWISSIAVEAFFRDPLNQSVESISFRELSNLTYLRLIGLSQLSEVNLSDGEYDYNSNLGITSLHLEKLPALEQVNINAGALVELSFSGLENLKQLRISCSISALPNEIGDLCALKELSLTGTPLKTLPDSIGQLSQLESLNLSGSSLTHLPDSIGQLSQLQTLDLGGSGLTHLPDSIGQLSQLQTLDLSGSGLTHLPDSIGGLTSLTSLDLSSTYLVNIPAGIGQMKSLQHLILPTTLERIPHEIGRLSALKTMCFGREGAYESDEPHAMANMRIIFDLCRQLEGAVKG